MYPENQEGDKVIIDSFPPSDFHTVNLFIYLFKQSTHLSMRSTHLLIHAIYSPAI